jgi:hypothetical protein
LMQRIRVRTQKGTAIHRYLAGSNEEGKKMNRFKNVFKPLTWFMGLLLAVFVAACGGGGGGIGSGSPTASGAGTGVGGAGQGPAPVTLGTAGNFAILAQSTITNVPTSAVTGDVGLSPATGVGIGLTCAEVTGKIYTANDAGPACRTMDESRLSTAITAQGNAYTDAAGRAPDYTELGAGNIGGLNLGPATYKWSSALLIPTNVTLTGGPNDVWIFQIAQGLTVSNGVQIVLAGGALAKNIYWQTFAAADIGTTSQFNGVILSKTSIAMKTGASINGRLLAQTAVTLDQNTVTQPAP